MKHLPGVVVGVLALALVGVGMVAPSAPASTPRARAGGDSLDSTETLLTYLPSKVRATCVRRDPSSFAQGSYQAALAVVECESPADGIDDLVYALYPDGATLTHDYQTIVPTGLADMAVSDGCTGAGDWSYKDQTPGGNDACFTTTLEGSDPVAEMAWTGQASNILGLAASFTNDGTALKNWWNTSSGPLEQPESVQFASMEAADRKAAGDALVHQTSKFVTKCKLRDADPSLYTPDDAEWALLPWVAAQELCKTPNRGVVYYTQVTPETARGFWIASRTALTDAGYPGTKHPAACKKARDLLNAKNQPIGKVQCWYFHDTLWANWYDSTTGVVGAASASTTPQKIFDYLNQYRIQ